MSGSSSVLDWVKENLGFLLEPAKLFGIPLFFIAVLGLIFNTMLASKLGFDAPDTFSIGDHLASGILLIRPAVTHAVHLAICLLFAAATVALVLISASVIGRATTWTWHGFIKWRARFARSLEAVLARLDARYRVLDFDLWRRRLRRRQSGLFRRAASIRREHKFLDKDRLDLDAVWTWIIDSLIEAWRQSRMFLGKLSIASAAAVTLGGIMFAATVAGDTVDDYLNKTWLHMQYSLAIPGHATSGDDEAAPKTRHAKAAIIVEPPLAWWDIAARVGDAAQGAINHAGQRPRLVSLKLKDDDEYLRPMLLVLDFGDELILYDFLADDEPADGRIYPIRTVKAADVASVVSSYTYDDPHTRQTDPSTRELIEVGQIGTVSAATGMIRAVCGKAGLDLPVVEVALAPSTWLEEFKYITQYHVDGDHISCGDVPEEAAKPVVVEMGDRTIGSFDAAGAGMASLAGAYVKAATDSAIAI